MIRALRRIRASPRHHRFLLVPVDRLKVLTAEPLDCPLATSVQRLPSGFPPVLFVADTGCRIGGAIGSSCPAEHRFHDAFVCGVDVTCEQPLAALGLFGVLPVVVIHRLRPRSAPRGVSSPR